jgi:ferredoxin, 2Fe-2S
MSVIDVTFVEENGNVIQAQVETDQTLMEAGKAKGVAGILADCGGSCACATCHVYVEEGWYEKVGAPDDVEAEMLDMVSDVRRDNSRLSCQIKLTEKLDGLKVTVAPFA